jgi:hypothetical protein
LDLRGRKWREAGEDCIMRSFMKYCQGVQIKEVEMGGAYSTNEKMYTTFWSENMKVKTTWKT